MSELSTERTYRSYLEAVAAESADVARDVEEARGWLRDDPEWTWARMERHEDMGARREFAVIIRRLLKWTDPQGFDPQEFAGWLWESHKRSNERRSESTGHHKRAAKGDHHASAVALRLLKEHTDVTFEDYGDTVEAYAGP